MGGYTELLCLSEQLKEAFSRPVIVFLPAGERLGAQTEHTRHVLYEHDLNFHILRGREAHCPAKNAAEYRYFGKLRDRLIALAAPGFFQIKLQQSVRIVKGELVSVPIAKVNAKIHIITKGS